MAEIRSRSLSKEGLANFDRIFGKGGFMDTGGEKLEINPCRHPRLIRKGARSFCEDCPCSFSDEDLYHMGRSNG